jgi:hypothetical protein
LNALVAKSEIEITGTYCIIKKQALKPTAILIAVVGVGFVAVQVDLLTKALFFAVAIDN